MKQWNHAITHSLLNTDYSERAQWARTSAHRKEAIAQIFLRGAHYHITAARVNAIVAVMPFIKWEENFSQEKVAQYHSGLGVLIHQRYSGNDTSLIESSEKDQNYNAINILPGDNANKTFKILAQAGTPYALQSFIPRMLRYSHHERSVLNLPELLAIMEGWSDNLDDILYALIMEFTAAQRKDNSA